jgi:hypothetical protein
MVEIPKGEGSSARKATTSKGYPRKSLFFGVNKFRKFNDLPLNAGHIRLDLQHIELSIKSAWR